MVNQKLYLHWPSFVRFQPSVQVSKIMLLCSYKKEECGRDPEETKLDKISIYLMVWGVVVKVRNRETS